MELHENAEIEQRGGKQRCKADLEVGNTGQLHHQESGGPHHGRQQSTAGGCDRLHRRRDIPPEPYPLHHRDRDETRSDHVGGGTPSDRAVQSAGCHRDLGRSASCAHGERTGQPKDEIASSGQLERGAEHHKDVDVRGGHGDRRAE